MENKAKTWQCPDLGEEQEDLEPEMQADPSAFPILLLALHPPAFPPHDQAGIHSKQENSPRSTFTTLQNHQPLK